MSKIDLEHVKGVLIDLDNTLYAYHPAHTQAMISSYEAFNKITPLSFEDFSASYGEARRRVTLRLYPQGVCRSRLFAFQLMCEELGAALPYRRAFELDRIYWGAFLKGMKVDPVANQLLLDCREARIPVCVVTDMTAHVQMMKLDRLGLTELIAHLVTSEEVGCEKPDQRMFKAALGKLRVAAADAIMVGDDRVKDIEGAMACGIRSHMVSAGEVVP